ncbi:hypothetical protein [Microcoleus sp. herbarium12]
MSKIAVVSLRKNPERMSLLKVTATKIPKGERVQRVENSQAS